MINKKDTSRSYAIWVILILFYCGFYFISNYAWVAEVDIQTPDDIISSEIMPPTSISDHKAQSRTSNKVYSGTDTVVRPEKKLLKKIPQKSFFKKRQKKNPANVIWINKATQEEWESLYNIGPYRAEKIINFRTALGGFYSVNQVGETYALPDSVFQQIKPQLNIKPEPKIKMLNLNTLTYDSLYIHPYITRQMAYFIVKHRDKNGIIRNFTDLQAIINEKDHERLRKLEPYLDFGIR